MKMNKRIVRFLGLFVILSSMFDRIIISQPDGITSGCFFIKR